VTVAAAVVAGAAGAVARFLLAGAVGAWAGGRWGTLTVNVIGSFALGALVAAPRVPAGIVIVAGAGFLGSFTTFSTFAVETTLLDRRSAVAAVAAVSVCALAAAAGAAVGAAGT
jgi:CrcB protein